MFLVKATECLVGWGAGFTTLAGQMRVLRRWQVGYKIYDNCRLDAGFGTMAIPVHESLRTTGRSDHEVNNVGSQRKGR